MLVSVDDYAPSPADPVLAVRGAADAEDVASAILALSGVAVDAAFRSAVMDCVIMASLCDGSKTLAALLRAEGERGHVGQAELEPVIGYVDRLASSVAGRKVL